MVQIGHLRQYLAELGPTDPHSPPSYYSSKFPPNNRHNPRRPRGFIRERSTTLGCLPSGVLMAIIHYSFAPNSVRPIDGTVTFFECPLRQLSMPHDDALVLTLEIEGHLIKRILIDHGSVADLLYLPAVIWLGYNLTSSGNHA